MIDVYDFGGQKVRTAGTPEAPLFCADDVCAVLGYSRTRDALRMLEQDEVEMLRTECATGQKQLAYVTESGLYTLILSSKRPEARAFKRWVTSDVLPAIRKTGSYGHGEALKALSDPAALRQLLLENVEKVLALEGEVAESRPKVEVYDRIVDSGDTVGFRESAKLIFAGTGAKEPEVKEFMLRAKWIQRLGGRLAPASYGQQKGYVTTRDKELKHLTNFEGKPVVIPELRITQRGVARAIERLNAESSAMDKGAAE